MLAGDGNYENKHPQNRATACLHCSALHRLTCESIDDEAVLILAPHWSQAALNWQVRAIHKVFVAHGEPPCLPAHPATDTMRLRSAYRAYDDFARRAGAAADILTSASPRRLGAALLSLPPERRVVPSGIRLLHLGKHFVDGRDTYPSLLTPPTQASST